MKIIEIKTYPVQNGGFLKGRADLCLGFGEAGEITIKGFRINQNKDGTLWIGPPSERYNKDGKTQFKDTVYLTKQAQAELYPHVINEFKLKNPSMV